MQLSNIPGKLVLPWATSGNKNNIPVASQIGVTAGAASLTDGFPPLTMTPVAAGGVPPSGLDMNGILYEMSNILRWANAGGGYAYDSTFANDSHVGGYPKGARVMRSDGMGYWFNTVDNNLTDPEAAGAAAAGWVPDYQAGATSVAMSGSSVTLTPAQYGKPLIIVTGALSANLNLIFPALAQGWTVINNTTGGYSITAKTASGSGVALGTVSQIVGDGTNIYQANPDSVQIVTNVATLRNITPSLSRRIQTRGYYTDGDGGSAQYFPKVGAAPGTYVHNGATVIVPNGGDGSAAWLLDFSGLLSALVCGAKGDNVADDTLALMAMWATNLPWYIPYTANGYKVTSGLTVNANGTCDGFLMPTTAVGSNPTVIIASSGYGLRRQINGLRVVGSVAVRAAGVSGIQVDCENALLVHCQGQQLNYGCIVRMYSVTLFKCDFYQNNTNLSAYARDVSHEINNLTIAGGAYDSAVNCAINIGDTSWGDAMPAGNTHGVVIRIGDGVVCDGHETRIDNVFDVKIGTLYCETSATGNAIRLGGSGDGNVRDVEIGGCFFKGMAYAIRAYSGVNGLVVKPNSYVSVTKCALYVPTDIYQYEYHRGTSTASFTLGSEVHTGFRWLAASAIDFATVTIPHQGLRCGVQQNIYDVGMSYPAGQIVTSGLTKTEDSGENFRRYTSGQTGIAGTVSSNSIFTFTTASQSAGFNGGDRVQLSTGGATFIRYVDYDNGIAYLDGATSNGAATLAQVTSAYRSEALGVAAPTTGTWSRGDRVINITPSVGQPKAWTCTAGGTPGTWVSEGNL